MNSLLSSFTDATQKFRRLWPTSNSIPAFPRESQTACRIAIVGAGITGVSAACQIAALGFDCHIFEAGNDIGGIWTRVNRFSALQVPSDCYVFHPEVKWKSEYPKQDEILEQIHILWHRYGLQQRTSFNCPVHNISRRGDMWIINDDRYGLFDGIIVAVGTCADAHVPYIPGEKDFDGSIYHSSNLDDANVEGKYVSIVGGGASAAEALEYATDHGAASVKVLARSNRWIVPRWRFLNYTMAMMLADPFGLCNCFFAWFLRVFCYRDLSHMVPSQDYRCAVFSKTPVVNSRMLEMIRDRRASWINCTTKGFIDGRLEIVPNSDTEMSTSPTIEKCDVCIKATGYHRPRLDFLSPYNNGYDAPNWYLQVFPPGFPTLCAINSTWVDGIGSVGAAHIGIYTRLLMVYVLDIAAQPDKRSMQQWVDVVGIGLSPVKGLEFVTTMQLYLWFVTTIVFSPQLWKWARFILFGDEGGLQRWRGKTTMSTKS